MVNDLQMQIERKMISKIEIIEAITIDHLIKMVIDQIIQDLIKINQEKVKLKKI